MSKGNSRDELRANVREAVNDGWAQAPLCLNLPCMQILSGWIQCDISSTGSDMTTIYRDQELHKWDWKTPLTVPSGMPTHENLTSVTWSVVSGDGEKTTTVNGKIDGHAFWKTGGSLGVAFRIWQDNIGTLNVTTPTHSIRGGYSVTQDIVGGVPNPHPNSTGDVSQPPIPQTLFSPSSTGVPPVPSGTGRHGFVPPMGLGSPFEYYLKGKWIVSQDHYLYGTMPGHGKFGYAPPASVKSDFVWAWQLQVQV
jgi:hypothetical protein